MSTTHERAKSAKGTEIAFKIVELTYAAWTLHFFKDSSSNYIVHQMFSGSSSSENRFRSDEDREKVGYDEERDFAFANSARIVILIVVMIVMLMEIGLEVVFLNRFNKAIEMSESNPGEALKNVVCFTRIQRGMTIPYALTILLLPAAVLRMMCVLIVHFFMSKLVIEMRNRIVPEIDPTFGEGRDGVIRTYPQSDTDTSIFQASSSDSSLVKTV